MNTAKALDIAFATILADFELGKDAQVRPWQALARTIKRGDEDRAFPLVDIRSTPPQPDTEGGPTLSITTSVVIGSHQDDDPDREEIAACYEACQDACDTLYKEFRAWAGPGAPAGSLLEKFLAAIDEALGADAENFEFGGLVFAVPFGPAEENGKQVIGIGMTTSYARKDF